MGPVTFFRELGPPHPMGESVFVLADPEGVAGFLKSAGADFRRK